MKPVRSIIHAFCASPFARAWSHARFTGSAVLTVLLAAPILSHAQETRSVDVLGAITSVVNSDTREWLTIAGGGMDGASAVWSPYAPPEIPMPSHLSEKQAAEMRERFAAMSGPETVFTDAMGTLIEGSSEMHAVAGIKRQVLFIQRNEPVALAPALEPIFALIEGGAGPTVHNAAAQALLQTPGRLAAHDSEYFIERTVALLWSSDTPEQAELPLSLLTSLIQSPDYVDLTVDTIAGQIDPHQDKWTVNPAAAAVMHTGQLRRLAHTPVRETAGAIMGQAIASPALDMDYLGDHFARGGGELATLDGNTVEGVIAVFSPTIFAEEKPVHYAFSLDSFMEPMLGRPAWLQRDPDGLEHWIAFLGRVAALDDPDFSPVAREALKAF